MEVLAGASQSHKCTILWTLINFAIKEQNLSTVGTVYSGNFSHSGSMRACMLTHALSLTRYCGIYMALLALEKFDIVRHRSHTSSALKVAVHPRGPRKHCVVSLRVCAHYSTRNPRVGSSPLGDKITRQRYTLPDSYIVYALESYYGVPGGMEKPYPQR